MAYDDNFWRAVADYALQFGSVASLGAGDPPSAWLAEYQRVRRTAFASVLITGNSSDGASANGERAFPQATLIDALHCRRYDLDATYTLPAHLRTYAAEAVARARGNRGFTIRFQG